jgi:DNA-binding response OmpR family regulator
MSDDDAARVFERFHQVAREPARGVVGTGIGLALVRDLVAAQGGTVELSTTLGKGTTVTVSVPVGQPQQTTTPPDAKDVPRAVQPLVSELESPVAQRSAVHVTSDRPRPHVLVVEDNPDLRSYLARLLTGDGWAVTAVCDVSSALRTDHRPDVILSDVMLPGRNGLELVRLIRAQPAWSSTPVVLLTARTGPSEVAEGLAAGANDYVRKPFEPVELLSRLRTHYELATVHGHRLAEVEDRAANLQTALTTNRQIGVAVGVLMSREKITSEQAFDLLRSLSNRTNRKLREVAEEVALTGDLIH